MADVGKARSTTHRDLRRAIPHPGKNLPTMSADSRRKIDARVLPHPSGC
jgi:hypothetical protein